MLKIKNEKVISVNDWDKFIFETYGKIYSFQQQDGCKPRGIVRFSVPDDNWEEDEMNDHIPEIINDEENMGVKFDVWLKRDINEPLNPSDDELKKCNYIYTSSDREEWCKDKSHINLFWERNFYPSLQSLANDLHEKGLLEAGSYVIEIDW